MINKVMYWYCDECDFVSMDKVNICPKCKVERPVWEKIIKRNGGKNDTKRID